MLTVAYGLRVMHRCTRWMPSQDSRLCTNLNYMRGRVHQRSSGVAVWSAARVAVFLH